MQDKIRACGSCRKATPHRLFGNLWRCSECECVNADRGISAWFKARVMLWRWARCAKGLHRWGRPFLTWADQLFGSHGTAAVRCLTCGQYGRVIR